MAGIKLGSRVTDNITGFTGIVTCRLEYLNGCVRYAVQPEAKDNKVEDPTYIDEQQLCGDSALEAGGPSHTPTSPHKL